MVYPSGIQRGKSKNPPFQDDFPMKTFHLLRGFLSAPHVFDCWLFVGSNIIHPQLVR